MKKFDIVFTAIFFYIGWFGCVFLGKTEFSIVSIVFPVVLAVYLHLKKYLTPKHFLAAALISAAGVLFDSVLMGLGIISTSAELTWLCPIWLISIWVLFSFSMLKLGPLFKMPIWVCALLGLFMGPLSYKSGEFFQVLSFSNPNTTLIYGLFWALMFPAVIVLSKRLT